MVIGLQYQPQLALHTIIQGKAQIITYFIPLSYKALPSAFDLALLQRKNVNLLLHIKVKRKDFPMRLEIPFVQFCCLEWQWLPAIRSGVRTPVFVMFPLWRPGSPCCVRFAGWGSRSCTLVRTPVMPIWRRHCYQEQCCTSSGNFNGTDPRRRKRAVCAPNANCKTRFLEITTDCAC
jgi:hypothetical protein